ncbi:DUF484 family protein [Leeia oryzae]|uniref:DUF484 family protein n=1 Tax=Leeia oryzae TaxID=356662 RepID=UPI00036F3BFA|nr:DUF484 family protein [Leeia oryzae]
MQAADIAHYLKDNPTFFEDYADLLADIFVPHPHGGHAISLAERQMLTLREKNRLLESKLGELLQFGEENDTISDKVHRIVVALLRTPSLEATINTFLFHLTENFNVPQATLRIWSPIASLEGLPVAVPVDDSVKALALDMQHPYCGPHIHPDIQGWFGEPGDDLKSFALVPLRHGETIGLLAMASEDPQRFYPEMGTLYLTRLGELLTAALQREAAVSATHSDEA